MYILKAEKRDASSKVKQLRRNGLIPAVLFGKHLEESVLIQISRKEAEQFLKTNTVGSKLELEIDGEKHQTMLKDLAHAPITGKVDHLGFIALQKGEKVKGIATIILIGREQVQRNGMVLQTLSEINYKALPSNLIDKIEVNIENLKVNENIRLSDLDIANNQDIELITPSDSVIVTVTAIKKQVETTTDTEEIPDESEDKTE